MTRLLGFLRVFGMMTVLMTLSGAERSIAGQYSIDIVINPYHPGIGDSWFLDINNQGQSAGYVLQPRIGGGYTRDAVIYRNADTQVLATATIFEGNLGTAGLAINNFGDVVGNIDGQPSFIAAGAPVVPIDVPGTFASLYVAGLVPGGVNDSGNVLLSAYPNDPMDTPPNAFSGLAIWNTEGAEPLSVLDPLYPYVNPPIPDDFNSGPSSSAGTMSVTHLNGSNQFAASIHVFEFDPMDPLNPDDDVFNESFTDAYIYNGQGGYSILESRTPGEEIRPIDIDEVGTVFGWAGDQLALWGSDGALQLVLPRPEGILDDFGGYGFPSVQRNNLEQVVALTFDGGVLFYDPVSNAWTDITPSIDGLGTGTFSTIQGFNDLGQFVGLVRPPLGGGVFGYVVSPVPEPSSHAISVLGLILAAAAGSVKRKFNGSHGAARKKPLVFR